MKIALLALLMAAAPGLPHPEQIFGVVSVHSGKARLEIANAALAAKRPLTIVNTFETQAGYQGHVGARRTEAADGMPVYDVFAETIPMSQIACHRGFSRQN